MRIVPVALALCGVVACSGGGGGGGGGGDTGTGGDAPVSDAAWDDGPVGHVYVYSGPLYDIDAHDGRILRELTTTNVGSLQANSDHAYFIRADDAGTGRVFQWGATGDPTMLSQVSNNLIGVYKRELVGQLNESKVVEINLDTGVDTQTVFPGVFQCQTGSIFEHTLYLACVQISATSTDAGMLTFDLDGKTFGSFVTVKTGVQPISMASNVSGTPSGAIFTLYEGSATTGTRTAYKISGATVSPGAPIGGIADDLDEQAAIGNMVYVALNPDQKIVPFDASTMTAGPPIALDHPRHLRAGGGMLWSSSHAHDGQLAKINPATGDIKFRTFPLVKSTEIDSLAFGGP